MRFYKIDRYIFNKINDFILEHECLCVVLSCFDEFFFIQTNEYCDRNHCWLATIIIINYSGLVWLLFVVFEFFLLCFDYVAHITEKFPD